MFQQAVPVWETGASWEMNTRICLCASLDLRGSALRIATAYFYRVWVNGQFAGFGPARAAKGYARVDELPLNMWATGNDTVCIEVVGYVCRSLSTVYQPSFVCAEICRDNEVLCATGTEHDFEIYRDPWYVQRTERFSMQRHFGEIYDKRMERFDDAHRVTAERVPAPEYLPRRVPLPLYRTLHLNEAATTGTFDYYPDRRVRKNHYSGSDNPYWGRQNPVYWGVFAEDEIPYKPFRWVKKLDMHPVGHGASLPVRLTAGEYILLDFGQVETGFLRWQAQLEQECDVILAW
jgi:alpha-L-rhamnosidase